MISVDEVGRTTNFVPSLRDHLGISWEGAEGARHLIYKTVCGEHCNPLIPSFSSWQFHALEDMMRKLLDGELIFAFVDNIYVLSSPDRVYNLWAQKLWPMAWIWLCTVGRHDVGTAAGLGQGEWRNLSKRYGWDAYPWEPEVKFAWQLIPCFNQHQRSKRGDMTRA